MKSITTFITNEAALSASVAERTLRTAGWVKRPPGRSSPHRVAAGACCKTVIAIAVGMGKRGRMGYR